VFKTDKHSIEQQKSLHNAPSFNINPIWRSQFGQRLFKN